MITIKQSKLVRPDPSYDPARPRPANINYVYALTAFVSLGALLFGYGE